MKVRAKIVPLCDLNAEGEWVSVESDTIKRGMSFMDMCICIAPLIDPLKIVVQIEPEKE